MSNRIPVYFVGITNAHRGGIPLALGMLQAYSIRYKKGKLGKGLKFLPTMDQDLKELQATANNEGPGIWLFSDYMWSVNKNLQISKFIKSWDESNITIHGGPSSPKYPAVCEQWMRKNEHIDIMARAEGEATTAHLLETLLDHWTEELDSRFECLKNVEGITFSPSGDNGQELVRTPDRPRIEDVNECPSPYIEGLYDSYKGPKEEAILETNRGCPYGCTFCDWGSLTTQKMKLFDLDRVKKEIDWIARHNIPSIFIADSNFGSFDRDIEVTEELVKAKEKYGVPRHLIWSNAKNTTQRSTQIVKILRSAGIANELFLSMQTSDPETLKTIKRSNIRTDRYIAFMEAVRAEKMPVSTDLMIGLPGATVDYFKNDLQLVFDEDIGAKIIPTQLLPNSPMADPEYLRKYKIEIDENDFLVSTLSYTKEDRDLMLNLADAYIGFELYSYARYLARYLQWDHGIRSADFLHDILKAFLRDPVKYPLLKTRFSTISVPPMDFDWKAFYLELAALINETYKIERNSAMDVALSINELHMPRENRVFPETLKMSHDFVSYFRDHQFQKSMSGLKPLASYGPGEISVTDPFQFCKKDSAKKWTNDRHSYHWSLLSELSRPTSTPYFDED